jgi:hypothetical protein
MARRSADPRMASLNSKTPRPAEPGGAPHQGEPAV